MLENVSSIGRIRKKMETGMKKKHMGNLSNVVFMNKNGDQKVVVAKFTDMQGHQGDILELGRKNRVNIENLRFLSEHERKLNEGFRGVIRKLYQEVNGRGEQETEKSEEHIDHEAEHRERMEIRKANKGRRYNSWRRGASPGGTERRKSKFSHHHGSRKKSVHGKGVKPFTKPQLKVKETGS
jgi:hypothetical protein